MYSHSLLETFEQCPRKYKFRYIDNLRTDTEGIEAFVGKRVHETLEKLYKDLRFTKLNSLDDLLRSYEDLWEKNWHAKVQITRKDFTPGHYFALGRQCIEDYYRRYHPFNQGKTLGLEERIELKLAEGERTYTIQGFIDRLSWVPETQTYEIHDYKTGSSVPSQEEADQDRQLALYQIGVRQRWPDAKTISLVWHFLASDREIRSQRTPENLQALQAQTLDVIHRVEAETQRGAWETRTSRLCDWCEYKPICPAWKHPVAMEALPTNAYLLDSGVALVRRYAEQEAAKHDHQAAIQTIEAEQKKIAEAAMAWAEKEQVSVIDGPDHRLVVRTEDDLKVPRKGEDPFAWELLRNTLKNAGKLEDVSTVNGAMLKWALRKAKWPQDVVKSIMGLLKPAVQKTVSLVKK